MNAMFVLVAIYALVVLAISYVTRHHHSADEYLMGGRKASAAYVGAALFTLVGGGELITLTALAYVYGWAGLALFVGYALGFCFLSVLAPKIRSSQDSQRLLSLPDYVHKNFGSAAGHLAFAISFAAFFALLLIQFTAGGLLLQPLLKIEYVLCVLITAAIAAAYLSIGGFRTVLATDMLQGVSRLVLLPLIIVAVYLSSKAPPQPFLPEALPIAIWISFIVSGFFAAASSADVWQRIYASRTDGAARGGLILGALAMLLFGVLLVGLGVLAHQTGVASSSDTAFVDALSSGLPAWGLYLAAILVLSTIMGTADTEIFLLAGMLGRELLRLRGVREIDELNASQNIGRTRILVWVIAATAVALSLIFRELIAIYTWLLSAILVIAPIIIGSLFFKPSTTQVWWSMLLNLVLFVALAVGGWLTPENAYLIVIPGFIIFIAAAIRNRSVLS